MKTIAIKPVATIIETKEQFYDIEEDVFCDASWAFINKKQGYPYHIAFSQYGTLSFIPISCIKDFTIIPFDEFFKDE